MIRAAAWILLAVLSCAAEAAGPVYRCGREYSQTPCPDGRVVEATDSRTAAQRAEARRVAAQERKLAAQMERDRRAQAAAQKPALAGNVGARPAPAASAPAKSKKKHAKSKPESGADFTAVEPKKK